MNIQKVRENMGRKNDYLSSYACKDVDAYRFEENVSEDFRTPFYRDIDRIIYSLSYTRYMDKTQVFSFNDNGDGIISECFGFGWGTYMLNGVELRLMECNWGIMLLPRMLSHEDDDDDFNVLDFLIWISSV